MHKLAAACTNENIDRTSSDNKGHFQNHESRGTAWYYRAGITLEKKKRYVRTNSVHDDEKEVK